MWETDDIKAKSESRKTGWDSSAVAQVRDDGVLDWVVLVEVRRMIG